MLVGRGGGCRALWGGRREGAGAASGTASMEVGVRRKRTIPITAAVLIMLVGSAVVGSEGWARKWGVGLAMAQQPTMLANPVYVDESPAAQDAQVRVRELLSAGNADEAARVLQVLLDEHADRVVASETDADLLVSVRARVHAVLRSDKKLLERYRAGSGARAEALLGEGKAALVERSFLMTPAGFDAALRLAQAQLEDAEFEGARLTLAELSGHPDASGERAAGCARLWAMLARYLDREDVRLARDEWVRLSGVKVPSAEAVEWPERAKVRGKSPMDVLAGLDTSGLVSKPLWTVEYSASRRRDDPGNPAMGRRLGMGAPSQLSAEERSLHAMPVCVDDLVLINDGMNVSAWDRFTLTARWTHVSEVMAQAEGRRGGRLGLERWQNYGMGLSEEPSSVSVRGRYAIAATGRMSQSSAGDDRVTALDVSNGRLVWSATVPELDPALSESAVRGPIEIVGNTAVLAVRKLAGERRLVSLSLAGVDMRTGKALWTRLIGSTGSMPWVTGSSGAEAMLADRGMVYRVDRLGVMVAAEAATGRIRWLRRMAVDPTTQGDPPLAFQFGRPVLDGETIIAMAPDGRSVKRVDKKTGAILASRAIGEFGAPEGTYLVRAGDRLAVVAADRVHVVGLKNFETAEVASTPKLEDPGIRGRVLVAGDTLAVPTATGLQIIDPAKPDVASVLPLDEMGNVLTLESQVVVVDDARVHSYLKWDTAERLLTERMKADPNDAQPAITLAELAYRADKAQQITPAVDAAMRALQNPAGGDAVRAGRERLFDVLHRIVAVSTDAGTAARVGTPDRAQLSMMIQRMGELAADASQKVAHALAQGRLAELEKRETDAAAAYQRVLLDPSLANANWRGLSVSVRGEIEAARRLEDLLRVAGPGAYDAQDALAASELASLGDGAGVEALESVAQRYPFARHVPALWSRIAELHRGASRPQKAVASLEAGLRAAQRIPSPDLQAVGVLAGRLVEELRGRGQLSAASSVLRTTKSKFPGATLTASGQVIDADRLATQLLETLAVNQRWPRVGAVRAEGGQALAGWTLMEPLLRDAGPSTAPGLALSSDEEVSLWTPPQAPGSEAQLVQSWKEALENRDARLIKMTSDAAYFLLVGENDSKLVKVLPGASEAKWSAVVGAKVFGNDDSRGMKRVAGVMNDRFDTPTERAVSPTDVLVAMDDRSIVLTQRGGRSAGYDIESGELLWSARTPLVRVHDCDLSAGWLALAGVEEVAGANGAGVEFRPSVTVLDARTGRLMQRAGEIKGLPHWVKLTENGSLIVGSDSAVASFDVWTGQTNWTLAGEQIVPAAAAWAMGDHLVLLTAERKLVLASISSGRMRAEALATPKTLLEGTRIIDVYPLGVGPTPAFAVATQQGVGFFTGEGALAGADGLNGTSAIVPPRPAENRAITIETISDGRGGDGMMFFSMLSFASPSGVAADKQTVLLGARPSDVALMDGRIAVTAGSVTVVMPAPAPPQTAK